MRIGIHWKCPLCNNEGRVSAEVDSVGDPTIYQIQPHCCNLLWKDHRSTIDDCGAETGDLVILKIVVTGESFVESVQL